MGPDDFKDLTPETGGITPSTRSEYGLPIPPVARLKIFSPGEWEQVVAEWAFSLKQEYKRVRRYGGPRDLGCDVVGFVEHEDMQHDWDNYQCKHYDHPINVSDVRCEFAKIIYHSYVGEYVPPRRYRFVAPLGLSTSLSKLLAKPEELRAEILTGWDKCSTQITKSKTITLEPNLSGYIERFDFSIFGDLTPLEIIEGLSKTPFFAARFGGGLPDRPAPDAPPSQLQQQELRYVEQLFGAYGEHLQRDVAAIKDVADTPRLTEHFQRSRENFFSAESLRNFARDRTPQGTFDSLVDDIYAGVVDTCEADHADGFACVCATTDRAALLQIQGNLLAGYVKVRDKHGMCHQLANDDRLSWVKKK